MSDFLTRLLVIHPYAHLVMALTCHILLGRAVFPLG